MSIVKNKISNKDYIIDLKNHFRDKESITALRNYFKISVIGGDSDDFDDEDSIDALYVASQIIINLQYMLSSIDDSGDKIMIGIGKMSSGSSYDGVAASAVLEGTTRTFDLESQNTAKEYVIRMAKSTAAIYGANIDIEFEKYSNELSI